MLSQTRLEVHRYHDYRAFLRDWIDYLSLHFEPGMNLSLLSKKCNISHTLLSLVLSGKKKLTKDVLSRMLPHLCLDQYESDYLENIRNIAETESQSERMKSLTKIQRSKIFQKLNPKEANLYRYLTHWYYIAIREMSALPDFRADEAWIRDRLLIKLPKMKIKEALDFLVSNQFIGFKKDGKTYLPEVDLRCFGSVYGVALSEFYREMLHLALESFRLVHGSKRTISSYTSAIPSHLFPEIETILEEARRKLYLLSKGVHHADSVYHCTLVAFPLTKMK